MPSTGNLGRRIEPAILSGIWYVLMELLDVLLSHDGVQYTGKGISLGNSSRARAVDLDTVLSEYTREELVEGAECSKCSK